jgi:hypothetical protein
MGRKRHLVWWGAERLRCMGDWLRIPTIKRGCQRCLHGRLDASGRVASALAGVAREMYVGTIDTAHGHRVATVLSHLRGAIADMKIDDLEQRVTALEQR